MQWFGRARVNINRYFPDTLKPIHFVPVAFVVYMLAITISGMFNTRVSMFLFMPFCAFFAAVFADSYTTYKSFKVAFYSIPTVFVQLYAYAMGMIDESLAKSERNDT